MDEPFANSEVPVNSTLKVKVSGTGSASQQFFVAHGSFERPDRSREEWMDTELPGLVPDLRSLCRLYGRC